MLIHLLAGMSEDQFDMLKKKQFPPLLFASDDIETAIHYYEGTVVILEMELDQTTEQEYIAYLEDMPDGYTWGSAVMECPDNSTWFSFSADYIQKHCRKIDCMDEDVVQILNEYFIEHS